MRDFSDFADAAVAHLRANLPGKLDDLDAAYADFALERPADNGGAVGDDGVGYSYGDMDVLTYPWIEVAVPDFTITNLSLGQVVGDVAPVVVVRILYMDVDRQKLRKAVMRYTRALLELLMQPGAFGAGEAVADVRGSNRFNPEVNESDELYGAALIVFSLDGGGASTL